MTAISKQTKSALHIEDHVYYRNLVGEMLLKAGYDVTQTGNLTHALYYAKRKPFDLYVSSCCFPETPNRGDDIEVRDAGVQLYKKVREWYGDGINFIILSIDAVPEAQKQCQQLGIPCMNRDKSGFDRAFHEHLDNLQKSQTSHKQ